MHYVPLYFTAHQILPTPGMSAILIVFINIIWAAHMHQPTSVTLSGIGLMCGYINRGVPMGVRVRVRCRLNVSAPLEVVVH